MKKIEEIKKKLEELKPILKEKFKIESIGIFGSYVKHEQKRKSDIDILVEFVEEPSLFEFIELEDYLSKNLGLKVDLVMKSALKPTIGKYILSEVVYI